MSKVPDVHGSGGKPMPAGYVSTATSSDGMTMQLPFTQIGVAQCAGKPCLRFTAERPDSNDKDDVLDSASITANFVLADASKSKLSELVGASFTTVEPGSVDGKPADMDTFHVWGREGTRVLNAHGRGAKVAIEAVTDTAIDGQFDVDVCTNSPAVAAPCEGKWHVTVKFHAFLDPSASEAVFAKPASP